MGIKKFFAKLLGFEGGDMEKVRKGVEEMEREQALEETTKALEELPEETIQKYERDAEIETKKDQDLIIEGEDEGQGQKEKAA